MARSTSWRDPILFLGSSLAFTCVLFTSFAVGDLQADDWTTLYGSAREQARQISSRSLAVPLSKDQWNGSIAERRERWLDMLGLSPMPARTPLNAKVTGVLERDDYVVEKIYFESMPGAFVFGNLYRPAKVEGRLPAVLYLCGHSKGKVNPPYQANTRWFGQHGYVALVLDPIQLGESQGFHHGTYRGERWDWPSRGYSPIGTEVWNAIRALDYLQTRPDVDGEKMGVTGLSGGGVVSWCVGAADERLKVVVPVCQSGSIEHVVTDRATDGHCDCAFWINYYRWCWPDLGALIAPRKFLIAAGSEDLLWRPYAYRDVAHRIRQQYSSLGVSQNFDLVEDLAPHGYTPKLRQAIFTWFNTHLKNDPRPVTDDVTDFVEPEKNLLVLEKKPEKDAMSQIDTLLVQRPELPKVVHINDWTEHQQNAIRRLRETTFRHTQSDLIPNQRDFRADGSDDNGSSSTRVFDAYDHMTISMKTKRPIGVSDPNSEYSASLVFAVQPDAKSTFAGGGSSRPNVRSAITTTAVEVRNTGATSVGPGYLWTARRTYPLLGETLPERQVCDLLAGIALLRQEPATGKVAVFGQGYTAPIAIYAALLDPKITEVVLAEAPSTHEDPKTPEFLGVLRVGDLPHNLALVFPRPITFVGKMPDAYQWTKNLYEQFGKGDRVRVVPQIQDWQPAAGGE